MRGTTCCSAGNPVDGFDASRATTARGYTPMLCKRTMAHEGSVLSHVPSVQGVFGCVKAHPASPASLRDKTGGYGPPDRRSNRLPETYTAEGRHSV